MWSSQPSFHSSSQRRFITEVYSVSLLNTIMCYKVLYTILSLKKKPASRYAQVFILKLAISALENTNVHFYISSQITFFSTSIICLSIWGIIIVMSFLLINVLRPRSMLFISIYQPLYPCYTRWHISNITCAQHCLH